MPLLEAYQVAAMLVDARGEGLVSTYICECGGWIVKDYCRTCDEFYDFGHIAGCSWRDRHSGHRTYLVPYVEAR